jgi:murein DD-endopeptidase MepM/ murein hydrolase activator NlpD
VKRIALLALASAAVAACIPVLRPVAEPAWFVYTLASDAVPTHLPNPVVTSRPRRLANSWGTARPGGRRHEGIDIFAPKGTPVVSTTRGIVTRVGINRLGGHIVGVLGPGLEWHYFAHLDRFGTLREGDIVQAGDVLGHVGNTGRTLSAGRRPANPTRYGGFEPSAGALRAHSYVAKDPHQRSKSLSWC